ncbi:MAG: hypothetical protein JXO22_01680 [Phycisphaerae bacterium]|nr:hypothetical protein [Phycisphaerae bacterium]
MNDRHTEFFGADLARGPFSASYLETSIVQIATALAQLRTPVERDDNALLSHADFIRTLADRLAPDVSDYVSASTTDGPVGCITTFRANATTRTLLRVWLADSYGDGPSSTGADTVVWLSGLVVQEIDYNGHYVIMTDSTGIASVLLDHGSSASFYWGVARGSRVFFAGPVSF